MKKFISAIALSAIAFSSAYAAAIPGLYNTGAGASGTIDSNYALTVISGDTISDGAYISHDSDLRGEWLPNSSTSKWLTPTSNARESLDPFTAGEYSYSLTFTLTADQAASASFLGRYAADNEVAVYLNGQLISSGAGFGGWTDFGASSGFLAGVNGLQFSVTNYALDAGNPTGLRVEFADASVPSAVPEPATYAMMLGGLGLLGAVARRKQRA
ncbi:PEPxxWA-CTERM sorting domain-containing protein [Oxalobacteraceae bacterium OTU3CAMAD1]|nr:PEPxxWA-CTERM sorting domain-containing protein [Oxalobacteraceae bacterium OTU3CAMAD1]